MKAKTHQSMQKRVSVTGSGKLMHKPAGASHLRTNKSPRRTVKLAVHSTDERRVKQMVTGL